MLYFFQIYNKTIRGNKMTDKRTYGGNRLIRRSVTGMFPSCFFRILAINFLNMIDAMLAGYFFTPVYIAAIGVIVPVTIIAAALMNAIAAGVELSMSVAIGAGDKSKADRIYMLGMITTAVMCALFLLVSEVFAGGIARVCGANEAEVAAIAASYLRFIAPYFLFLGIKLVLTSVLSVYGYQNDVLLLTVIEFVINLLLSALLAKYTALGIAALAIGSWVATFISMLCSVLLMKLRKLPILIRRCGFKASDAATLVKYGFPTSADNLAAGFAGSIVNNIIAVSLGTDGLAVYSVISSIGGLILTASDGMRAAMCPMIGIFAGSRDKNGVKKTLTEGLKITYVFSIIWIAVILLLLTPIIHIYTNGSGAEGIDGIIRTGVYIVSGFTPIALTVYIMAGYYEAIDKPLLSVAFSASSDSIILPLMMLVLVPALGYKGMWLAYGGCEMMFLIIAVLLFLIHRRKIKPSLDEMLFLDESIRGNVPMKDISIRYSNTDISGLSAEIQQFLENNGTAPRTAYMSALCMEEMAADFIAHSQITNEKINENRELMDIKLLSDNDKFRIIIRNTAKHYNPLDFEYDPEDFSKIGIHMAQKVAEKITYGYAYKMNIITIDMKK